eukprot:7049893-Pyramimonas_sp.AAC.1
MPRRTTRGVAQPVDVSVLEEVTNRFRESVTLNEDVKGQADERADDIGVEERKAKIGDWLQENVCNEEADDNKSFISQHSKVPAFILPATRFVC